MSAPAAGGEPARNGAVVDAATAPGGVVAPSQRDRIRVGLWLNLGTVAVFAVADPWVFGFQWATFVLKALDVSAIVLALTAIRAPMPYRSLVVLGLGVAGWMIVSAALQGMMLNDLVTTSFIIVMFCVGAAAFVQWGALPQTALAAMALAAILCIDDVVHHTGAPSALIFAVVTGLAGSVALAWLLRRWDLDRKRAEQAEAALRERRHADDLMRAARLTTLGGLAAGLAHEINQPLGAIVSYARGMARRIRAGHADAEELASVAEAIAEQGIRAAEVLRRMRGFLRQDDAPHTVVDLRGVVTDALRFVQGEARDGEVFVHVDAPDAALPVRGDPVQLMQVTLNLLHNAFAAVAGNAASERQVRVRATRVDDRSVEVAVFDAGTGIPPGIAERLFDPFVTTRHEGLGIGLAVSRSIVEAHGGRLWSSPNTPNGAIFRFVLPIATSGARSAA